MPHCIIEYSNELYDHIDIKNLMHSLNETIYSSGLFDLNAIKIRAKGYEDFALPSECDYFVHIQLRILEGRTKEQKEKLAESVQKCAEGSMPKLQICLTTEICDMDKNCYKKAI